MKNSPFVSGMLIGTVIVICLILLPFVLETVDAQLPSISQVKPVPGQNVFTTITGLKPETLQQLRMGAFTDECPQGPQQCLADCAEPKPCRLRDLEKAGW